MDKDNLGHIYDSLQRGDLTLMNQNRAWLSYKVSEILDKTNLTSDEVEELKILLQIGNITYNNLDSNYLPIEDGVYDLLLEKYRRYTKEDIYPVGAKPVHFESVNRPDVGPQLTPMIRKITDEDISYQENMLFPELLTPVRFDFEKSAQKEAEQAYITKQYRDTMHRHPDLVGTFDKCKFVLTSQAAELGVDNDPRVRIVERDFFLPLLNSGIINPSEELTIIAELKYDGISVEADCTDQVISARSRGDTDSNEAKDLTPLLQGYQFNRKEEFPMTEPIGVKFEAIINEFNLDILNSVIKKDYVNCRTAIIGVQGSSLGRQYQDLISLIPIATDIKDLDGEPLDRLVEIELLNRFFRRDEMLRYSIFTGNYMEILFQMKRYVEEAEYARNYLPFMFDGVVFEFYDKRLRLKLGRDHSIDRYKVAVKFNPLSKQTVFRGYDFAVGQDGSITPMIYYDPVEFMGTKHNKSSGHSFKRFKDLNLRVGDIITVSYVNDVMPYVTKPDIEFNRKNDMKPYCDLDKPPKVCPSCGGPLTISNSGDSIYCLNLGCPARTVKRMANMFTKLGIKDFNEETVKTLNVQYLHQLMNLSDKELRVLGPNDSKNLKQQLENLRTSPIYDFKILGSLGFTGVAIKTWKLILQKIDMDQLLSYYNESMDNLRAELLNIKGIGVETINIIIRELPFFMNDIIYIAKNMNVLPSKHLCRRKKIRFTGCRDQQLVEQLSSMGYDIDGNAGVTKDTDYLLVPYPSYSQGNKYAKAVQYGIQIVPIEEFEKNLNQYL